MGKQTFWESRYYDYADRNRTDGRGANIGRIYMSLKGKKLNNVQGSLSH